MTDEIINKMKVEINGCIRHAAAEYNAHGRTDWYERTIDRICGMIKMLTIATGNDYYFDEDGLHERKAV